MTIKLITCHACNTPELSFVSGAFTLDGFWICQFCATVQPINYWCASAYNADGTDKDILCEVCGHSTCNAETSTTGIQEGTHLYCSQVCLDIARAEERAKQAKNARVRRSLLGKVFAAQTRLLVTPEMRVTNPRYGGLFYRVNSLSDAHEYYLVSANGTRTTCIYRDDVQNGFTPLDPQCIGFLSLPQDFTVLMSKAELVHHWMHGLVSNQEQFLTFDCKRHLRHKTSRYSLAERASWPLAEERDARLDASEKAFYAQLTDEQASAFDNPIITELWKDAKFVKRALIVPSFDAALPSTKLVLIIRDHCLVNHAPEMLIVKQSRYLLGVIDPYAYFERFHNIGKEMFYQSEGGETDVFVYDLAMLARNHFLSNPHKFMEEVAEMLEPSLENELYFRCFAYNAG